MSYFILIISFAALIFGANFFVSGSSSIAKKLKVSSLVIGLTIVAFGTSAPEAAVSISASINGKADIAVANILGSNIFNMLVVLGASAIITPMIAQKSIIKKEFPFVILSCLLLFALCFDSLFGGTINSLSRGDGMVLLLVFGIFLYSLLMFNKGQKPINTEFMKDATTGAVASAVDTVKELSTLKSIIYTVAGLALIIVGGKYVVESASEIAKSFGASENLIGLTIVAIGTSLPELVTSIVASKKGERDIAIGNVLGSNIFNVFFILGISACIAPLTMNAYALYDVIIMTAITVVGFFFALSKSEVNRYEGIIMVLAYVGYSVYICLR